MINKVLLGYLFQLPTCMMTSSNWNILRVTGHLCGEFTGHRWIPFTKASDAELWCFLWYAPEKNVSKQSWGWWFGTPSRPLWHHCDVAANFTPDFAQNGYSHSTQYFAKYGESIPLNQWSRMTHICVRLLSLVHIMVHCLSGTNALSEPILGYC